MVWLMEGLLMKGRKARSGRTGKARNRTLRSFATNRGNEKRCMRGTRKVV